MQHKNLSKKTVVMSNYNNERELHTMKFFNFLNHLVWKKVEYLKNLFRSAEIISIINPIFDYYYNSFIINKENVQHPRTMYMIQWSLLGLQKLIPGI